MKDIEIARNTKLENIEIIAEKIGIPKEELECYGKYKAKIPEAILEKIKERKNGKLVLVTAINPTPLGEGKTTISIGLGDALNAIGKKTILALREPSLGPVFGIKGGATGGGYSQIAPMEDINLHFTGDIHAITAANNLISAIIDNHIFHGNELKIKKVVWKRCLDINDRQLRKIETGLSNEKNIVAREDGFDISVASEIMAILCLSKDIYDLKQRVSKIIIGYTEENKPVTVKDLKIEGSVAVILKDALNPNLVQTLEHNPAIVHGGPFANIAHGCNSIRATKLALKLADYTVTEAGFGADLGAEKFINIKCRKNNIIPDVVVCVATIKALKYHGGASKEKIFEKNITFLEKGMHNLFKHINNIKKEFGLNVIVAINKYKEDFDEEIELLEEKLKERNVMMSLVESWEYGSKGAIDLAEKVVKICDNYTNEPKFTYKDEDSITEKIEKVAKKIYGAENVEYSEQAKEKIKIINELGYSKLPVCIAKTQYSFSDDPKNLECNEKFTIHVHDVELKSGAEFIVILTGKVMTMPGLPKKPAAEDINLDNKNNIIGIF